jgi:hypothetical protein
MAAVHKPMRLIGVYLLAYVAIYLLATVVGAIYLNFFTGDTSGAGLGLLLALPIMFVVYSIMYFFVPASTLVGIYFSSNFILKERGSQAVSIASSVGLAVAVWAATFPVAISLINVVYASKDFLMLKEGSWAFIYLTAWTNLAGLIVAVLWVKLKPAKAK